MLNFAPGLIGKTSAATESRMANLQEKIERDKQEKLYTFFNFTLEWGGKPIPKGEPFTLIVTGCPDGNIKAQQEVAACIARVIKKEYKDNPPLFGISAGDHGSGEGTDSPASDYFFTYFHQIYSQLIFPWIMGQGNHDGDVNHGKVNFDKMYAQIAHTVYDFSRQPDPKKIALFNKPDKTLDLKALTLHDNKWNILGPYGVVHCGNTDIYYIDGNTIVEYFTSGFFLHSPVPHKLIDTLFNEIKNSDALHRIVVIHNSPFTNDKRRHYSDHSKYLSAETIKILQEHKIIGEHFNYNDIIANILFFAGDKEKNIPEGPGKRISLIIAAHTHANHFFNNGAPPKRGSTFNTQEKKSEKTNCFPHSSLCQVVVGAGGCGTKFASNEPSLQNRYDFNDDPHQAAYIKAIGFLALEISPDQLGFNFHTVDTDPKNRLAGIHNLELRFTNKSNDPIQDTSKEPDERFIFLREMFAEACRLFLIANQPKKPSAIQGKVIEDIEEDFVYIDRIRNYFNNFKTPSLTEALRVIEETHTKWPKLYEVFQSHFLKTTGISIESFENFQKEKSTISSPITTLHKTSNGNLSSSIASGNGASSLASAGSFNSEAMLFQQPRATADAKTSEKTERKTNITSFIQ